MSQHMRDLRNAGVYLLTLLALVAGVIAGGALVIERNAHGTVLQTLASVFEDDDEPGPTRLSLAVEEARQIRAKLEKPLPPPAPLPPITAQVAHGDLRSGRASLAKHRVPRLPKDALDAMASTELRSPPPRVELHKVY